MIEHGNLDWRERNIDVASVLCQDKVMQNGTLLFSVERVCHLKKFEVIEKIESINVMTKNFSKKKKTVSTAKWLKLVKSKTCSQLFSGG